MEFIDFDEANLTLGPPRGMTEDQVRSIRAYFSKSDPEFTFKQFRENGGHFFVVMAKFTPEEIEQLNKTGCICLKIMGEGFPPVALWPAVPLENREL